MLQQISHSLASQVGLAKTAAPRTLQHAAKQPQFASNTITVMGNGFVNKTPDRARLNVSIQEDSKDKNAVTKSVTEKAEKLMAEVKALNPDFDLSSGGIRVNEKTYYDQATGKHKKDGWTVSFQLTITDKSANLDDLKARAAKVNELAINNCGTFNGASGYLSERRLASGRREALDMAYTDAFKKANRLAKSSGHGLEALPVSVVENGSQQVESFGRSAKMAMAMAAPGGSYESADAAVSDSLFNFAPHTIQAPTITVVYDIKESTPGCAGGACDSKLNTQA